MKIAVDAMGGDFGPAVVVEGAVAACREMGLASVLVGDKAAVEREIARLNAQDLPITVRHASQVVGMGEAPSQALRRKRDSSLRVAAELVREGECDALVSAGNTGAAMAIGMHVLGVLPSDFANKCLGNFATEIHGGSPHVTHIPLRYECSNDRSNYLDHHIDNRILRCDLSPY